MKAAIFSDLHLNAQDPKKTSTFAAILRKLRDEKITELWLLGDIFDLLVGPFAFWQQAHAEVFSELKKLSQAGVHVLWCEGNHDFHIKHLEKELGLGIFDDQKSLVIEGRQILLAHGDLVDANDHSYLKWRATTRNPCLQRLISLTPTWVAEKFLKPWAEGLSAKSRGRHEPDETRLRALYRQNADQLFAKKFTAVFMGHCHVFDLYVNGESFYLNLGSWLEPTWRYAIWEPQQTSLPVVNLVNP